jgi:alpha-beta hydrolase superfamily lysophospholipase
LPTVLWFHGFTAGKATHRPEFATLAEAGFLAVGIDAAGHGEIGWLASRGNCPAREGRISGRW